MFPITSMLIDLPMLIESSNVPFLVPLNDAVSEKNLI